MFFKTYPVISNRQNRTVLSILQVPFTSIDTPRLFIVSCRSVRMYVPYYSQNKFANFFTRYSNATGLSWIQTYKTSMSFSAICIHFPRPVIRSKRFAHNVFRGGVITAMAIMIYRGYAGPYRSYDRPHLTLSPTRGKNEYLPETHEQKKKNKEHTNAR